jgi:hypothetical protein
MTGGTLTVAQSGGTRIGFDYYPDGQLAAKAPLPAGVELTKAGGKSNSVSGFFAKLAGEKPDEETPESSAMQTALNQNLREQLVWDGLALLYRNGVAYAVEPHVSGGVPVTASAGPGAIPTYYVNDILGTTLAVIRPDGVEIVPMTAFGKPKGGQGAASALSPESALPPTGVEPPSQEPNSVNQQKPVPPAQSIN